MGLLERGFDNLIEGVGNALQNPMVSGGTGILAGAVLGSTVASSFTNPKPKARKKKSKTYRTHHWKGRWKGKKSKHRTSPKGKLTYHHHRKNKAIHYTKNGQPYIIKSDGKARFISKRGASASKKRRGGRY